MAESVLADQIEREQDALVARFVSRVMATIPSESLEPEAVENSLRPFLHGLAMQLREVRGARTSEVASEHGSQRFHLGYDAGGLIREYALLHEVLFEFVRQWQGSGTQVSVAELDLLSRFLLSGMADAATRYASSRDAAVEAATAKYIGLLSHEIRNPLQVASLAVQRLKSDLDPEKRARVIQSLVRSLATVGRVVDDALVEVRLRARIEPKPELVEVASLFEELIEDSRAAIEASSLAVRLELAERCEVLADRRLLKSALSNLVRNAVKFSNRAGDVILRCRQQADHILLEVEDACGGLAPETVSRLCSPALEPGEDRSVLGVAIAAQAVHAHGGGLRIKNVPNKGCVFVLDLPSRAGP